MISRARLILSSKRPDGYEAQVSYSTTAGGPLPELKQPDHAVNHSPPLSADVKQEHVCVHCSMCLHDVKRDNLTVIIIAGTFFFAKSLLLNYGFCLH